MTWGRRCGWLVAGAALLSGFNSIDLSATADENVRTSKTCSRGLCKIEGTRDGTTSSSKPREGRTPGISSTESSKSSASTTDDIAAIDRTFDAWIKATDVYRQCLTRFGPIAEVVACGTAPDVPDMSRVTGFNRPGTGAAPTITPAQAGAIAVARLQLPTLPPGIGPSPELNPWKIAAVGYPLWLWPDGPTQVGPVSDSVAGLNVSLTAKVSEVSFRMGDGNTVTCPAESKRWTNAVQPGQKSPTCGYSYEQPSLPKGNYTIAAVTTWDVTWTVNNQSGVIRVPAVQTAQLPVGELQVLVR